MPFTLQLKRGTTSVISALTSGNYPAAGELLLDTSNNSMWVGRGTTTAPARLYIPQLFDYSISPRFGSNIGMGNDSEVINFNDGTSETDTGTLNGSPLWTNKDRLEIRGDGNSKAACVLNVGFLHVDSSARINGVLVVEGDVHFGGTVNGLGLPDNWEIENTFRGSFTWKRVYSNLGSATRYYLLGTLPASSAATGPHVRFRVTGGQTDSTEHFFMECTAANRTGLLFHVHRLEYASSADYDALGIAIYQEGDGSHSIYLKFKTGYYPVASVFAQYGGYGSEGANQFAPNDYGLNDYTEAPTGIVQFDTTDGGVTLDAQSGAVFHSTATGNTGFGMRTPLGRVHVNGTIVVEAGDLRFDNGSPTQLLTLIDDYFQTTYPLMGLAGQTGAYANQRRAHYFTSRVEQNNTTATRYYKFGTLYQTSGSTGNFIRVEFVGGKHPYSQNVAFTLNYSNRDGDLRYLSNIVTTGDDDMQGCGIAVFEEADGSHSFYIKLVTGYYVGASVRVQDGSFGYGFLPIEIEDEVSYTETPTGTLDYDTTALGGGDLVDYGFFQNYINNYIGIGTSNPAAQLHVFADTSQSGGTIRASQRSSSDYTAIDAAFGLILNRSVAYIDCTAVGGQIQIRTSNAAVRDKRAITINAAAQVGIGDGINPNTSYNLATSLLLVSSRGHMGGQITSSSAALQVNGFMRTGNIYLHSGGNTPNTTRSNDFLGNPSGDLTWQKNGASTNNRVLTEGSNQWSLLGTLHGEGSSGYFAYVKNINQVATERRLYFGQYGGSLDQIRLVPYDDDFLWEHDLYYDFTAERWKVDGGLQTDEGNEYLHEGNVGVANGLATLDEYGLVSEEQIPAGVNLDVDGGGFFDTYPAENRIDGGSIF